MNKSPEKEIPWELIADSLTGNLDATGEEALQHWIGLSGENHERYRDIKKLWEAGIEDFRYFRKSDPEASWLLLRKRMDENKLGHAGPAAKFRFKPYYAYAAAFIGILVVGVWMALTLGRHVVFETTMNQEQKVELKDGTVISLKPLTRIEVPRKYNLSSRKVVMKSGEAFFDVVHNAKKPFTVELDKVNINDIGTSFTIRKSELFIDLAVLTGKASIQHKITGERRQINAGSAVTFDIRRKSFRKVRHLEENLMQTSLVFRDTPLSGVIDILGKAFSKKIIIPENLADLKFTGQLDGLSFNEAIDVICRSLALEYTLNGDIYMIKKAVKEQD